jgi:hypothetical protein
MHSKISIILVFLISIIVISSLSASPVEAATYCTNHAQCAKACSNICPSGGYGCCVDGDLGQCNTKLNECYCSQETAYCSSCPDCDDDQYCNRAYNVCKPDKAGSSPPRSNIGSTQNTIETISGILSVDELAAIGRSATATVESEVIKTYTLKQTLSIFEDAVDDYIDANAGKLGELIPVEVLTEQLKSAFKKTYAGEMYDEYKNEITAAIISGDTSSILLGFKRTDSLGIDLQSLDKGDVIKVTGVYTPLSAGEDMLYAGYSDDVSGRFTATEVEMIKQSSFFSRFGRLLLKIVTFGIVG